VHFPLILYFKEVRNIRTVPIIREYPFLFWLFILALTLGIMLVLLRLARWERLASIFDHLAVWILITIAVFAVGLLIQSDDVVYALEVFLGTTAALFFPRLVGVLKEKRVAPTAQPALQTEASAVAALVRRAAERPERRLYGWYHSSAEPFMEEAETPLPAYPRFTGTPVEMRGLVSIWLSAVIRRSGSAAGMPPSRGHGPVTSLDCTSVDMVTGCCAVSLPHLSDGSTMGGAAPSCIDPARRRRGRHRNTVRSAHVFPSGRSDYSAASCPTIQRPTVEWGGWFDLIARADHISYAMNPVRSAVELSLPLMRCAALPKAHVPVLLCTRGRHIRPENTERGMRLVNSPLKESFRVRQRPRGDATQA
jgi:hypothetical protein